MEKVLAFFHENPTFFFATVGLDGRPKVRPFGLLAREDDRLYLCTGKRKDVYRELIAAPDCELCGCSAQGEWVRVSGRAIFDEDMARKGRILDASPAVKGLYGGPENPDFAIFYLSDAKAVFYSFSGPPTEVAL